MHQWIFGIILVLTPHISNQRTNIYPLLGIWYNFTEELNLNLIFLPSKVKDAIAEITHDVVLTRDVFHDKELKAQGI